MIDWRAELRKRLALGRECVMITLAEIKGSAPQQSGAKLIVDLEEESGTIGGGKLEWLMMKKARDLLENTTGDQLKVESFSLGKRLGQCCGGVVTLVVQRLSLLGLNRVLVDPPVKQQDFLMTCLNGASCSIRWLSQKTLIDMGVEPQSPAQLIYLDDQQWLLEDLRDLRSPVLVFGAGHVGQALMSVLVNLPFAPRWIDPRPEYQSIARHDVSVERHVDSAIHSAPSGAIFVVMTYDHELDFHIVREVLARGGFAWLGVIGSKTKSRRFRHQLRAAGFTQQQIDAVICPIGLPGIDGKEPAVIASSVSAQLLMLREALAERAHQPRSELHYLHLS
ncbi:MAG: xanthine dehydrogenase accessory protein XdhC [Thiotrichales bacterium]